MAPQDLEPGRTYSWEQLGEHFGFRANYLSAAGGMPVLVAALCVVLVVLETAVAVTA